MKIVELTEKIKEILNKVLGIFSALLSGIVSGRGSRAAGSTDGNRRAETGGSEDRAAVKGRGPRAFFSAVWGKLKSSLNGIKAANIRDSLNEKLPGFFLSGKRRFIFLGAGGSAALLLIILLLVSRSGNPRENDLPAAAVSVTIPSEDFFIPAEPDFVPEFLPEREPRRFWTLDDIRPYWKTPGNAELWRAEIKSAVDKLMEGVP